VTEISIEKLQTGPSVGMFLVTTPNGTLVLHPGQASNLLTALKMFKSAGEL
jgi:hypothetical protein